MGSGLSSKKGFTLLFSLSSNRSDQDEQGTLTQVHPVWSMAVAQNGKQLAAATADHQIHLWCLVTYQILISLRGHGDTVWQVTYSPDNRLLASASADGTIRIWEVDTGFPMGVLPRTDANWIWCLSFSPDSMTLVSGGADTRMTLWDVRAALDSCKLGSGRLKLTVRDAVTGAAFNPSFGAHPLEGYYYRDGTRINGKSVYRNFTPQGHQCVIFFWEGWWLADCVAEPPYGVDAMTGQQMTIFARHTDWRTTGPPRVGWNVLGPNMVPNSSMDLLVMPGNGVSLLDGRQYHQLRHPGEPMAPNAMNRWVLMDHDLGVEIAKKWFAHDKSIHSVCFAPRDARKLASVGADGTLAMWDAQSLKLMTRLMGHIGAVCSVSMSPMNDNLIATGGDDHTVRLWSMRDLTNDMVKQSRESERGYNLAHHILRGHQEAVTGVKFCPTGHLLASCSKDMTAHIWNASAKQPTLNCKFQAHEAWCRAVDWTDDMSMLLTASTDGLISLWRTPKGSRKAKEATLNKDAEDEGAKKEGSKLPFSGGGGAKYAVGGR
eukprot:gnl/MRDRNA2_/MRDRNA2_98582_c0_seq1.p1 gnl/MRDRNA2_/MRDRNA2_98582_c0~~gnl/MRDRNA2_/MRDRNA2_98582_c0_seq1.p1  ORF type:complete len:545 (-),score=78.16 gnl/MRDRNA2_/MRDRNA2_98582_c0_seq1:16-1650(-)